ncbi:MAG: hypothetical protein ABR562_07900, partial [Thermoplasmatota archaeon]
MICAVTFVYAFASRWPLSAKRPPLPMGSIGLRSSGFWGMVFLVLSEASLFAYLFFSYFYFSVQPHPGP